MLKYRTLVLFASLAVLMLVGAGSVQAFHFEKVSEDTQRLAPQPQQEPPGGPQTSVGGNLEIDFATFAFSISQANDCGTSCDNAGCSTEMSSVTCTNLATTTFVIEPDPGEAVGDPVGVCVEHSYEMSVTSTGTYSGYAATGGVPTVTVDPAPACLARNDRTARLYAPALSSCMMCGENLARLGGERLRIGERNGAGDDAENHGRPRLPQ
jgi:hypothetical protein